MSNRGRRMPAPTSTSRPIRESWARTSLDGLGPARALEDDVEGLPHEVHRHEGNIEGVGRECLSGADGEGPLPPSRSGLAHDDVLHSGAGESCDCQQADGARTRDEHPFAWADAAAGDRVEGDGQRFGEGCGAQGEGGVHRQQAGGRRQHVAGEGPLVTVAHDGIPSFAQRRASGRAVRAGATPDDVAAHDGAADVPTLDAGTDGRHPARPLVPADASGLAPSFENHVEIAPADAAVADLDEHLAGPGIGHGPLFHLDLTLAPVHRGGHRPHEGIVNLTPLSAPGRAAQ